MHVIGAHVDSTDPLAHAAEVGARAVQFFLSDPQGWKKPVEHPHADEIRGSDLTVYIHSPYLVNVATTNNKNPHPESQDPRPARRGGDGNRGQGADRARRARPWAADDPEVGFDNWRKTFARAADDGGYGLPILIENTAGGTNAMVRTFDRLARLWDAIGEFGPGFCLDTCHAHAGGEELLGIVDRVVAITGGINLVHANKQPRYVRLRR